MDHGERRGAHDQLQATQELEILRTQAGARPVNGRPREVVEVGRIEQSEHGCVVVAEAGDAAKLTDDVDAGRRFGSVAHDVANLNPGVHALAPQRVDHRTQRLYVGVDITKNTDSHIGWKGRWV